MTDVGLQPEGESGYVQAKRRAGNEQQDCLHGLHEGAAVQDGQLSARPVKINIQTINHPTFYRSHNLPHSSSDDSELADFFCIMAFSFKQAFLKVKLQIQNGTWAIFIGLT